MRHKGSYRILSYLLFLSSHFAIAQTYVGLRAGATNLMGDVGGGGSRISGLAETHPAYSLHISRQLNSHLYAMALGQYVSLSDDDQHSIHASIRERGNRIEATSAVAQFGLGIEPFAKSTFQLNLLYGVGTTSSRLYNIESGLVRQTDLGDNTYATLCFELKMRLYHREKKDQRLSLILGKTQYFDDLALDGFNAQGSRWMDAYQYLGFEWEQQFGATRFHRYDNRKLNHRKLRFSRGNCSVF
ncbi:MAG: hypothetical protein RL577_346 [Bacteroidota bacterium]|jgi:hypothetical protein